MHYPKETFCPCDNCHVKRVGMAFGILIALCVIGLLSSCSTMTDYNQQGVFRERWGCVHYRPDGNLGDSYETVLVVGETTQGAEWLVVLSGSDTRVPVEMDKQRVQFFGCPNQLSLINGDRL